MSFATGSLVKARGREWVVLPESDDNLVVLRPLGGTEDEITGIYLPLEKVEPATFAPPGIEKIGDDSSCRLLRNAVRLGFRSSAGPFRSFGRISVEPRPYQIVPLLMAMKLETVRLLIADDVGIGKTIEAALIARELLDRGEIERIAVLCPPHLALQWQQELFEKFSIHAELILADTVRKLEQNCGIGQTVFELYPHVIVSMDFIKSDRHRADFVRACPEFVIVDEAHSCAFFEGMYGVRHQRHRLLKELSGNNDRHIVLVTATPHSGKAEAFRSLLSIIKPEFGNLPDDLSGDANLLIRRKLADHLVQRTRADIRHFLKEDTPFPERIEMEKGNTYNLSTEYKAFFAKVITFLKGHISENGLTKFQYKIRWWSALALLRAITSSPAAAVATLRSRSETSDASNESEADALGRESVMDEGGGEGAEMRDVTPGSGCEANNEELTPRQQKLIDLANEAETLKNEKDAKLQQLKKIIKLLLAEERNIIVFCRFIDTAVYVAEQLRDYLPKSIEIAAVTGTLPASEREERVGQLAESEKRILVATDCLSEGVNLQHYFDAVVHYDLAWSPSRHEQRVGRVDRYGQVSKTVASVTLYGSDNPIDGIVLDILLTKHKTIQKALGVSVPVPANTGTVMEAIFEGLLLRDRHDFSPEQLNLFGTQDASYTAQKDELHVAWDSITENEKRSRTMFAQESTARNSEAVLKELNAVRSAIGGPEDVEEFVTQAVKIHNGIAVQNGEVWKLNMAGVPFLFSEAAGNPDSELLVSFKNEKPKATKLFRTHPIVDGMASYIMDGALDEHVDGVARRAGVIRSSGVERRTTLLLVRYRFDVITSGIKGDKTLLAEECRTLAFAGAPEQAEWLTPDKVEELLKQRPSANINPDQARHHLGKIIEGLPLLIPQLEKQASSFGAELLDAHTRVRKASEVKNTKTKIEAKLPADILGLYLYLPVN